jgi:hypothetical protein
MLGEAPRAPTPDVNGGKGAQAEDHDARVEAMNGEIHLPPRHGTLKPLRLCVRWEESAFIRVPFLLAPAGNFDIRVRR